MNQQDAKYLWAKIIRHLNSQSCEIQTIRLNKTSGLWFLVAFEDNSICIDYALAHTPSAKISGKRYISEEEFVKIAYYFEGWLNGNHKRSDIRNKSKNTSYIFALVSHFNTRAAHR
jgi:hypothetical protein